MGYRGGWGPLRGPFIWSHSLHTFTNIICIVVQFCAMAWYALSYIPYGRRIFKSCLRSAVAEV